MERLTPAQQETLRLLKEKKGSFTDTEKEIFWQLTLLQRSEAAQQPESKHERSKI